MKIETKFNVNDSVFFMDENNIKQSVIKHIEIHIDDYLVQKICYSVYPRKSDNKNLLEDKLFSTKEELKNSL